ncbi:MAG TPA: TetR/AcrR family transcriptional regulator [Candidatus Acidoferrales bacterium]|nr:TetR/AcrR family transcriptional regulator [Candidatus Acidoferrales bacterium]
MARPKEFDPERALDKAMRLFWRLGYENTSLEALMREMGIARQSLYDTFGDKRGLYLRALAHYRDQTNGEMQKMLDEMSSIRDGFAKLLYGLAAETREQHERGCLLLSANLQRDTKDRVMRDFLRDNQARVEAIFVGALERAQKEGELSTEEDFTALARFFVVTIQGMRALARLRSDRKALEKVAEVALAVFPSSNSKARRGKRTV